MKVASDGLNQSGCDDMHLQAARQGSMVDLGELMESCRTYLLLVANRELESDLQGKVGASDLVQESFLHARRAFHQFQGKTLREFQAWLRGILVYRLAHARRGYRQSLARDVKREVALDAHDSSFGPAGWLVSPQESPSQAVMATEEASALHQAIARLPLDYQRVIVLRNWELRPFPAIGQLMNRSEEAARALWLRAIARLERELPEPESNA